MWGLDTRGDQWSLRRFKYFSLILINFQTHINRLYFFVQTTNFIFMFYLHLNQLTTVSHGRSAWNLQDTYDETFQVCFRFLTKHFLRDIVHKSQKIAKISSDWIELTTAMLVDCFANIITHNLQRTSGHYLFSSIHKLF